MNYVIAVLADRIQAEAAYSALEKEKISPRQVSIVGKGYKSAAEFSFLDPKQSARRRALLMALWLVPFGFIAGCAFNLSTQYQLIPSAGTTGNLLIGGVLGAIGGVMGSLFVGGGIAMNSEDSNSVSYHKYFKEGKYLVVVSGQPNLTNKATRILRQLQPENLQSYIDPSTT